MKDPLMQTPLGLHHIPVVTNRVLKNKHPKRKNNEVVAAMYAMYQSGRSLADIAKTYRKTRQAIYDIFRSRGYALRSKPMRDLIVLDGINFTLMKGGYLRGTIAGKRIMIHHYIWEKQNGVVPRDCCVHHIDGDPKNNKIENLELVPRSEMSKRFNPHGNNQYTKI